MTLSSRQTSHSASYSLSLERAISNRMRIRAKFGDGSFDITSVSKTYLCGSTLAIWNKSRSSSWIFDVIFLHPVIGILHSLGSDTCHFRHSLEINLQPPLSVISTRWPSSAKTAVTPPVETGVPRRVVNIVVRRSSHHWVRNSAVFETEWHITMI